MFKFLKSKLKSILNNLNKEQQNETPKIIPVDDQVAPKANILSCEISDNLIRIQILKECTFEEYVNAIDAYEQPGNKIEIPIRMFVTTGGSFITTKLLEQLIFEVSIGDVTYCIVDSSTEVKISERSIQGEEINEITLEIYKNSNKYSIAQYIHGLNLSTKSCMWYPIESDMLVNFELSKSRAIELFKILLLNLENIKDMPIFLDMPNLLDLVRSIGDSILDTPEAPSEDDIEVSKETVNSEEVSEVMKKSKTLQ